MKELNRLREPDVENRLTIAEQTLSLVTILTRALSQSQDLCLCTGQEQPGWSLLSDLSAEALAGIAAVEAALPFEATSLKAPGTAGAR